jgi:hypothetical protein
LEVNMANSNLGVALIERLCARNGWDVQSEDYDLAVKDVAWFLSQPEIIELLPPENADPWVTTFTGKQFYVMRATPDDIDIRDIAHGLSNVCRYAGQCQPFYSVAEHSIRMCEMVDEAKNWEDPDEYMNCKLTALLHDAAEAYLGDMPSLVKACMPVYRRIESYLISVIYAKYRLSSDPLIKTLDEEIRTPEVLSLLVGGHKGWSLVEAEADPIIPWSSPMAEMAFLKTFKELTNGR